MLQFEDHRLTARAEAERLEIQYINSLNGGDYAAAYRFADRRLRAVPTARATHHVMRAEALYLLGEVKSAQAALERAVELDPAHHQANRRILTWGNEDLQKRCAERVIEASSNSNLLLLAMRVIARSAKPEVFSLRLRDGRACGWLAWNGDRTAEYAIVPANGRAYRHPLHPSKLPGLGEAYQNFARFDVDTVLTPGDWRFELKIGGETYATLANEVSQQHYVEVKRSSLDAHEQDVSVIVPIFGDFEATRSCIESLRPQLDASKGRRALLIDDASPDRRIREYLGGLADDSAFIVVRNARNLGFAQSINQGLMKIGAGDVLLLNSDTLLPPRCIEKFVQVARNNADIGTITPLSNNGDFATFPHERLIDAPNLAEVNMIDDAASASSAGIIDLPNGIGFCLFVTRRCLCEVGLLSPIYGRGYYEDVDFCLRAREKGLRNVCATSIYVGHLGSRSFGDQKRSLVVRNLRTLRDRFPDYDRECAAFVVADPLRRARQKIERSLKPTKKFDRLIICDSGLGSLVARDRVAHLMSMKELALTVTVKPNGGVSLAGPFGEWPQEFDLTAAELKIHGGLAAYLQHLPVGQFELLKSKNLPREVLAEIELLGSRVDLISFERSEDLSTRSNNRPHEVQRTSSTRAGTTKNSLSGPAQSIISGPGQIALILSFVDGKRNARRGEAPRPLRNDLPAKPIICGVVPESVTPKEFIYLQEIFRRFVRDSNVQFLYLAKSISDVDLAASGNVFVSGNIDDADFHDELRHYRITHLFLPEQSIIAETARLALARQAALPLCLFDREQPDVMRQADCVIEPGASSSCAAVALKNWFVNMAYRDEK